MPPVAAYAPKFRAVTNTGAPAANYQLFTYLANTNTKSPSYADQTGDVENANPAILDARGECDFWLNTSLSYHILLCREDEPDPPVNCVWSISSYTPTFPNPAAYILGTWNANDKTRNVALSDANATATMSNWGVAGSFVRSTAKGLTAGKFYTEFAVNTVEGLSIGFVQDTAPLTVRTGKTYFGSGALCGIGSSGNLSTLKTDDISVDETGMSGFIDGDTGMIALDLINGNGWIGKNGVWFNSGDPVAGTNPQWSGISTTIRYGITALHTGSGPGSITLVEGTPPTGYRKIYNTLPAAAVRFIRLRNFTASSETAVGVTFADIVISYQGADITPSGVMCSYYPNGSHPQGGDIDPTLILVDGLLDSEASWTTEYVNSDFFLKFALPFNVASGPDAIKWGREKYTNANPAMSFDVEGSYDDLTYFTLAEFTNIFDFPMQTYSDTYSLPFTPSPYTMWDWSRPGAGITLSNYRLTAAISGSSSTVLTILGKSSGKHYVEITCDSIDIMVGVDSYHGPAVTAFSNNATGHAYSSYNGNYYTNGSGSAYGASFGNADVIGLALDMDGGTVEMFKNGASQGVMATGLSGIFYVAMQGNSAGTATINTGGSAFAYSVPTGFNAGLYT